MRILRWGISTSVKQNYLGMVTTGDTVLLRFGQVVNDAFAPRMPRQLLMPATFLVLHGVRFRPAPGSAVDASSAFVIVFSSMLLSVIERL
jgi:hypothetical protein